jgi:hypothetical protein
MTVAMKGSTAAIGDVVPCGRMGLMWFLLHWVRIVEGLIVEFSTFYNAVVFSIIVRNVLCLCRAASPGFSRFCDLLNVVHNN